MPDLLDKLDQKTALKIKNAGYLMFLVPPAVLYCGYILSEYYNKPLMGAFFTILFVYAFIPIADVIVGRDTRNPTPSDTEQIEHNRYFSFITLLCLPVQLICLFLVGQHLHSLYLSGSLSFIMLIGWIISSGLISVSLSINVAHELIHKNSRLEQTVGGILLSTSCYGGFKVEHIRGHHVNVSTPEDTSSSRFNQTVYSFVPRAIILNTINAWRLEIQRLAKASLPAFHWKNELLWWYGFSIMWAMIAWSLFGIIGLIFFLAQSLVSIIHLELINFVEHYGLHRRKLPNGKYERTTIKHSWNSSFLITNLLLFQIQRHSDHHEHPKRRYQILRHFDESPQLPSGYATMVVISLFPPLWRYIMNPRVLAYYKGEETQLTHS